MRSAGETGQVVAIDFDGIRFSLELQAGIDRYISVDLARHKVWEPFETRVFRALCRPRDLVIDIGANIGWYSLIASKCLTDDGKVLALEPEPRNFELLLRNLFRNDIQNVVPIQVAVTDRDGIGRLFLSSDNMGDHRLFEGSEERAGLNTKLATLGSLINKFDIKPSLIKSDTQGSELSIVRGLAADAVDPTKCCWLIEFWPHGLHGMDADPKELLAWFSRSGYLFFEVSESNPRLVHTNVEKLLTRTKTDLSKDYFLAMINLLLIHPRDERIAYIQQFIH